MDERQKEGGETQRKPDTIQRKPIRRINHLRKRSSPFWLHDVDGTSSNRKSIASVKLVLKAFWAFMFLLAFVALWLGYYHRSDNKDSWLHEKTGKAIDFLGGARGD
ncbi:MAG TPA: hypothetical protein DD438_06595 [Verrucomicrobiales bacterium]|nr:hypothetical protein [Roseibacillus sp.]HBM77763.1 hypothetical protein [Verrucomicrobiales bacterium]